MILVVVVDIDDDDSWEQVQSFVAVVDVPSCSVA